jgi:hypothetical protein
MYSTTVPVNGFLTNSFNADASLSNSSASNQSPIPPPFPPSTTAKTLAPSLRFDKLDEAEPDQAIEGGGGNGANVGVVEEGW